jgi:y4mF family transcriptional regulator
MIPNGKNITRISSPHDLGKRIRKARKQQGLTQVELAGLSGVGTRFLSELERGKGSCELGKTMHILKMLGLRLHTSDPIDD